MSASVSGNLSNPIPPHTSSRRTGNDLVSDRDWLEYKISEEEKSLERQASFSSEFWETKATIAAMEAQRTELHRKIRINDFAEWDGEVREEAPLARSLFLQIVAAQKQEEIFRDQSERLNPTGPKTKGDAAKSMRRTFVELFTKEEEEEEEDGDEEKDEDDDDDVCREALIEAYNSKEPDPEDDFQWCPIEQEFYPNKDSWCRPVQFFAHANGQHVMDAIFRKRFPPELINPRNGMIVSDLIASRMEAGYLAIVPYLPDNPSEANVQAWNNSSPKEYMVRVLQPKAFYMNSPTGYNPARRTNKMYKDLDGQQLVFRNDFRPRPCYLYFHYVCQMLKLSWIRKANFEQEPKRISWGIPGQYMPRNMLLGLLEEMGPEYDWLMEGAIEDPKDEGKDKDEIEGEKATGLLAATIQIKMDGERTDDNLEINY